jgi:cytochrome P450
VSIYISYLRALNFENVCQALRLATGSMTVREVVKPCSLVSRGTNLDMRVGSRIALFPPLIHYDESLFPAASEFRWLRYSSYMSDDAPAVHTATAPPNTATHNSPLSVTPASSARPNALSRSVMPFGGAPKP